MSLAVPGYWFWGSLPLREAVTLLAISLTALAAVHLARGTRPVAMVGGHGFSPAGSANISRQHGVPGGRRARPRLVCLTGPEVWQRTRPVARRAADSRHRCYRSDGPRRCQLPVGCRTDQHGARVSGHRDINGIRSGFDSGWFGVEPRRSLAQTLPRIVLGPFPWELGGAGSILLLDAVVWWMTLMLVLVGLRTKHGKLLAMLLLPTVAGLFIALALYSGNYWNIDPVALSGVPVLATYRGRWSR